MHAFAIPWPCLDDNPKPHPEPNIPPKSTKTFAQALPNVCNIPTSQFPTPCVKGDRLSIAIPDEEYLAGMNACKHNLQGRIVWPKGATPLTVVALKKKLSLIWKDLARWGVASLGKGYYEFCFSSLEDVRRVRSVASWNLDPGSLKLFAWSGDFNPNLQKNTNAQVWVRLYGLSQEYWRPKILFAIASSIGTPICTDAIASKSMFERTFGQYARVLVDMDLSQTLRSKVLVERKGFAFFVDLDYENLPDFCTHCKMVGHYVEICKNLQSHENVIKNTEAKQKVKNKVEKKYVQTAASLEKNKVTEMVDVSDHPIEGSKSHPVIVADGIGESSKVTNNLLEASIDDLVQQNKFNILQDDAGDDVNDITSDKSIGGEDMITENVLEDSFEDVEENNDNSSSTDDSQFVDATQFQKDDTIADDQHEVSTPISVQNDMRFLKESWATMVDQEEQEAAIAETSLVDAQKKDDGFQIQMSKHQKKAQKKRTTISSKDSYATRSKVSSKPSK
ncbi:hypothetical protein P8452_14395 [Trifolium repens]|nr:hypothetical protein P8452_14395 [Trifolium repens]